MARKRGRLVAILVLLLLVIGVFVAEKMGLLAGVPIVGNTIGNLSANVQELNYSIIIFAVQWIVIMIIIIAAYLRYIRNRKKEKKKVAFSQKLIQKSSSQTDFDVLYNLLKQEKSLSTGTIAAIFKIKKDIALEWAKILESDNLATVEYPAFGDPEVSLKEDEEEKEKYDKKDEKNMKKENNKKKEEFKIQNEEDKIKKVKGIAQNQKKIKNKLKETKEKIPIKKAKKKR